ACRRRRGQYCWPANRKKVSINGRQLGQTAGMLQRTMPMHRRLLLLASLLFALPIHAGQQSLQLFTEEYPPVSFSRNGVADGMATELVREILRRLGETASIQVVPWPRGYLMVQRTPGTGLFATIRSAQREADFKWV